MMMQTPTVCLFGLLSIVTALLLVEGTGEASLKLSTLQGYWQRKWYCFLPCNVFKSNAKLQHRNLVAPPGILGGGESYTVDIADSTSSEITWQLTKKHNEAKWKCAKGTAWYVVNYRSEAQTATFYLCPGKGVSLVKKKQRDNGKVAIFAVSKRFAAEKKISSSKKRPAIKIVLEEKKEEEAKSLVLSAPYFDFVSPPEPQEPNQQWGDAAWRDSGAAPAAGRVTPPLRPPPPNLDNRNQQQLQQHGGGDWLSAPDAAGDRYYSYQETADTL